MPFVLSSPATVLPYSRAYALFITSSADMRVHTLYDYRFRLRIYELAVRDTTDARRRRPLASVAFFQNYRAVALRLLTSGR